MNSGDRVIDLKPYKEIFDHSPVAFALLKVIKVEDSYDDFLFLYANKGYEALSGFSVERLNGHCYSEICGRKSAQWNNIYGKVAYEGTTFSDIQYGPEIERYVNIQAYQVKLGYCAVTVLDVNASVEAEQSARQEFKRKYEVEKERRLRDGKFIAYGVFDLKSKKPLEMEFKKELIHLDPAMDMEAFSCAIAGNIFKRKQAEHFLQVFSADYLLKLYAEGTEETYVEFQRQLPSGRIVWVKAQFSLLIDPETMDLIVVYSCYNNNVAKSLELMTAYITGEDYDLSAFVNFSSDTAIMLYGNRHILGGNEKTYREEGYTASLNWFLDNMVIPEEREAHRPKILLPELKKRLREHKVYEFTIHVKDRMGEIRTKKIKYTNYDEKTDSCMFTQVDITDVVRVEEQRQKELQEALSIAQKADAAKTAFFSQMSHDLRTPMNGILGLADLSLEEENALVLKDNLEKISRSGKYLLGLINDTLDFQKIQNGKLELSPNVFCIYDVYKDVYDIISEAAKAKGVTLKVESKGENLEAYVDMDALRLKQILVNLLSNAVKFTPRGGTVEYVSEVVKREGNISHVLIRITDTGIGMSEKFLKHGIFKAFSQDENQTFKQQEGTGLGLSIAKRLIELMKGSIEVKSELGTGTTFTLNLPFICTEKSSTLKEERGVQGNLEKAKAKLRDKTILIAEDQSLNAEVLTRVLGKVGCKAIWAKNGKECLEMFMKAPHGTFDAILMDVRMPVMGGMETTREIRKLKRPEAATIPIIAVTANAYDEDAKMAKEAGMNAHVAKPLEPNKLYMTLASFL